MSGTGRIVVVGIGPGSAGNRTPAADQALCEAQVILGYESYLDMIQEICPATPRESSGMGEEVGRAKRALELARAGTGVAVVSDGDAGVYGMAGLVFEVLETAGETEIPVEVIPGISALNAAAAVLGAPLMSDFAAVSLSDYLTPQADILRRVEAAARAGFVLCLYNPSSRKREGLFQEVCAILQGVLAPSVPVGIVRNACRNGEETQLTDVGSLSNAAVDMQSIVIVGNVHTFLWRGKMITRRGYQTKYDLRIE